MCPYHGLPLSSMGLGTIYRLHPVSSDLCVSVAELAVSGDCLVKSYSISLGQDSSKCWIMLLDVGGLRCLRPIDQGSIYI